MEGSGGGVGELGGVEGLEAVVSHLDEVFDLRLSSSRVYLGAECSVVTIVTVVCLCRCGRASLKSVRRMCVYSRQK